MDEETARQIVARLQTCVNLLSEVVQIAHANCGDEEDRLVRRGVGYVLSEMQDRLTDPIFREHPDLIPQGVDYEPMAGPTLTEMVKESG
ncbi:MAG: hypothetical protein IPM54_30705 [Polyangiaceae bacterium]|nr:hypothetical protein [Polyangiaceae bacterium]